MIEEPDFSDGEIPIFDMKNFTMRHLTKIVLPVVRKYMVYSQESSSDEAEASTFNKCTPFLDRFMGIMKPFLKTEVAKMIHFHLPNSETLMNTYRASIYQKKLVVQGEDIGTEEKWYEKIMKNRDYVIDETRWQVDENLRPTESNNKERQLFGMEGSFRALTID
ncbi:hypothetical protein NQ317_008388 [Molorchus minor]|uniref:CRAL-TRIO domain-containing protein n=1 Tax=Molorchus minor TaxID=1323400 RepID=A0ABQ9K758_9CUCU|nr:hypothetical protein NQ317_008388 [Molorchus minor]